MIYETTGCSSVRPKYLLPAATEGWLEREVNVLLGVETDNEGGYVHNLDSWKIYNLKKGFLIEMKSIKIWFDELKKLYPVKFIKDINTNIVTVQETILKRFLSLCYLLPASWPWCASAWWEHEHGE